VRVSAKRAASRARISCVQRCMMGTGFVSKYTMEGFVMPLINLVVVLIVVGVLLWLVNNYIPMAGSIKKILNVVVVVVVVLWLLNAFGVLGSLSKIRV
jgi:hypothetical protein